MILLASVIPFIKVLIENWSNKIIEIHLVKLVNWIIYWDGITLMKIYKSKIEDRVVMIIPNLNVKNIVLVSIAVATDLERLVYWI